MNVDEIVARFAELTGDAVSMGFRARGQDEAVLVWANDAFVDLFGYSREEVLGKPVTLIHDPEFLPELYEQVKPRFQAGDTYFKVEVHNRTRSGRLIWMSMSLFVLKTDAGRYSIATYRDLTELKEREAALKVAEQARAAAMLESQRAQSRLADAINAFGGLISIWDKDWFLVSSNAAFEDFVCRNGFDCTAELNFRELVYAMADKGAIPEVKTPQDCARWLARAEETILTEPLSVMNSFPDGLIVQTSVQLSETGDLFVISTDITGIEKQRKRLEEYAINLEQAHVISLHQALHDELTGLGNRRFLNDALEKLRERRDQEGGEVYALHIDLDRFKHVNDTQGHKVGDALLKKVSTVLRKTADSSDVVARIGGDEFLIVRYSVDAAEHPSHLAQAIIDILGKPIEIGGQEVRIGASVGIAATDVSDQADLLVNSDVALYKAKAGGRNRFVYFCQSDLEEVARVKRLSDEILQGLERREFVPVYQPQVCARTGALLGFEALARWQREDGMLWTPDTFLSIAEELNVVEYIDEMIFDRAMGEMPDFFSGEQTPSLSFNVSELRLMSSGLIMDAKRAMQYPGEVSFELLESVFMDDENPAMQLQIDTLKDIGVGIEIDDFGSGHASIIGLEQVAPSRLKIDRRLIAPITQSNRSLQMVRSIVEIGQALDIGIIAEGVETEDHASLLAEMNVDRLQGYLFARPTVFSGLAEICRRLENRAAQLFAYENPAQQRGYGGG